MPYRKIRIALISIATCLMTVAIPEDSLAQDCPEDLQAPFEYMITKVNVLELDESLEFYASFFGYKEVLRTPVSPAGVVQVYTTKDGCNFRHGLTLVHEKDRNEAIAKGALNTIVFSVLDIVGLVNRIEAAGYEITMAPFETKNYATPVTSSAVIAYAVDPNGYPVEMVEWKP